MHFLVLQHEAVEHPGIFRSFLKEDGITYDAVELQLGESLPLLDNYDALWVMGGPMDVWQEDQYPWLKHEKDFIRKAVVDHKMPFLSLCLGHQLLAEALGGQVGPSRTPEVGIMSVDIASNPQALAIFEGLPTQLETLQWHGAEVTELPDEAINLAHSQACEFQAISYGEHAVSAQFHMELEDDTVDNWAEIPAYAAALEKTLGKGAVETLNKDVALKLEGFSKAARIFYNNWKKFALQKYYVEGVQIMSKRVCIIGAGPSGLAQLRAFKSVQEKGAEIPEIVCYEKQPDWGGLWRYTWRTGVDEHGNQCHGSMYRYLWSNGPKEGLEFADYTFEEHFGKPIASYPPRAVLFDYIEGRVKKAGVRDWIEFDTIVRDVRAIDGGFEVTARNETTDTETTSVFDHVIVATGHFSVPNVPYYPGFESFNGRILHAHDFRDAREFADKDILILGTSYSAEDIGSQCWKYGCKSVTVAHRTAPMGYDWPDNWQEVPALEKVEGKTAYFIDGTTKDVDAIILCTGYKHHFPFLPDALRLKTANRLAAADLYKGVVYNHNPDMFYLGMQDQWFTFNMFDAQAWYVRDIIMGRIDLPDADTMAKDVVAREEAEDAIEDDYASIAYQGAYTLELIEDTDYPSFDVEAANQAFYEWKKHKKKGIMGFRNYGYKSPMTGTMAPEHHTPWVDALDDSLESYLKV